MSKSFKENFLELSKKFGKPYALQKKGIKRGIIQSILKGSMPKINEAYDVAQALEITMEELYIGTKKIHEIREEAASYWGKYRPRNQEEEKYIGKMYDILRGADEDSKTMVKKILDNTVRDTWTQANGNAIKKN